ncbi:MAG: hypothetical protein JJ911_18170 [Rhizobiaceae bacterium]|nr:hypothetical protein [Rhizobiaceae bacterium]
MRPTIGIDIGTSAVKVLALDGDGRTVLAEASRPYATLTPKPGWVEQSPDAWWDATCAALAELHELVPPLDAEAIGLSGQVNGLVLLDAQDRLLGNSIIWLDARASAQAERLQGQIGERLAEKAATDIGAISVLAKLAWLAECEPERLAKARTLLFVKDYIAWRLTGAKATDASDPTAAGMLDISNGGWLDGMAQAAGFDPAILPPIKASTDIVGAVTAEAAAATGLREGTPVACGGGDVTALAVGCGVMEPGVLGITLGTAGHVVMSMEAGARFETGQGLWRVAHADTARAVWLGLVMSGGLSLSWLHRMLGSAGSPLDFNQMVALADDVEPGAGGVSFVPFLEGSATPYVAPGARGQFAGMSSSVDAGYLVQAVMEGVAFNVRQCVDVFSSLGAEISEVRIAEGGARVDQWCQAIADVLGKPVTRLDFLNTSSLGAALMAHAGVSGADLSKQAGGLARGGQTFQPRQEYEAAYADAYQRYLAAAETEIARANDPRVR